LKNMSRTSPWFTSLYNPFPATAAAADAAVSSSRKVAVASLDKDEALLPKACPRKAGELNCVATAS
jgi:hypothetical protein